MAGSTQARDLTRLPVAGMEGRTMELFINPSRGDFDRLPDSQESLEVRVSGEPGAEHHSHAEAVSAGVARSRSR